jgi:hypothetical protein
MYIFWNIFFLVQQHTFSYSAISIGYPSAKSLDCVVNIAKRPALLMALNIKRKIITTLIRPPLDSFVLDKIQIYFKIQSFLPFGCCEECDNHHGKENCSFCE